MDSGTRQVIPSHRVINPSILYVGTPVALITTLNADGTPNISPMSSAWALGDRVVLGMSTGSQGSENAVREGECSSTSLRPACGNRSTASLEQPGAIPSRATKPPWATITNRGNS